MVLMRRASLLLLALLVLWGCEGNGTETDATSPDTVGTDTADDADTVVPPDVCCKPDVADTIDAVDAVDAADAVDTDAPDVPHPAGCCEAAGDCAEGSVCLGLAFGAPGTCWPAPVDGGCFFDADCAEGERCLGEHQTNCMMSSLPWEGTCVKGPSDCCESDQDCAALGDYVCAAEGGLQSPGICMPRPAEGQCWSDRQCADDEHCEGPKACGCLVDCDLWIEAGSCVPDLPGECCHSNADCPEGYCVAGDLGAGGVCHTELLPDGSCFTDADCGGEEIVCTGAQVCSCDMNCVSFAGTCRPLTGDCCFTDDQCPAGQICAGEGPGGYTGVCKLPAAPDGKCWDDFECGFGSSCVGAAICPCDADCDMEDTPGTCALLPGCCTSDEDCDLGIDQYLVCAGFDLDPAGLVGKCVPPAGVGECWDDLDCGLGQVCSGSSLCPCDAVCGMIEAPGTCIEAPSDCCFSDVDCGEGEECVDLYPTADTDQPGACKPIPWDGMCWSDVDCPGLDQMCLGAVPCPCNLGWEGDGCDIPGYCIDKSEYGCCNGDGDCGADQFCLPATKTCVPALDPGHCFTSADCSGGACVGATFCPCGMMCAEGTSPGVCQELPVGCCNTDLDCGEGLVCRAQGGLGGLPGSCVPDPLGPQCLGDAACCWNDADCPGSSTCKNAYACGCIALCPMCGACAPDQMGYCGF